MLDRCAVHLTNKAKNDAVAELETLGRELGGTVGQLAIAWANKNPRVSTVILGASKVSQLRENLGAISATGMNCTSPALSLLLTKFVVMNAPDHGDP